MGGGVGLAAVGADLVCFRGQLFDPIGVPRNLRSHGTREGVRPVQGRLIELLDERPCDLVAAVHLVEVPGAGGTLCAPPGRKVAQQRVTNSFGPNQGVSRPGQRLLQQGRHEERDKDLVEDPHDDGVVARGSGDGDGLVGQGLAAFERTLVVEFRAQGGEHERPVGMVVGEQCEGPLQDLDLVGVDDTDGGGPAPVVGQGGGHEPVGVTEIHRPASRAEERVAKGGVSGLALGGTEADGQIESEHRIGLVGLGVEVEGLGVVAQRVGWRERGERGIGRLAGVVDRLGQVDRLGGSEPVAGQLTHPGPGPVAAEGFERFGHLPVRPRPAVGAQVVIQRVLDQRVSEAVAPGLGQLAHQGHGRRSFEDVEQIVF